MSPRLPTHSAPLWYTATTPAVVLCLLLLPWSAGAFSVPTPSGSLQYRLVDHVDQLQQQRGRPTGQGSTVSSSDPTATSAAVGMVPPPHLFRIPAPGGAVCLVVDENGVYHAVRDAFPPLGLPVSETGVVDTQVSVIGDTLFGTRFNLSDGTVRGPWCPGGTAGPLLRITRNLRGLFSLRTKWMPFFRRRPLLVREDTENSTKDATRPPPKLAAALEVLPITENTDGSLDVTLPPPLPPPPRDPATTGAGIESSKSTGVEGDVMMARDSTKRHQLSWVADCGLAGYEH